MELVFSRSSGNQSLEAPTWAATLPTRCSSLIERATTTRVRPSRNDRRPYPNIAGVNATTTFGYGNYHGVTAKLEKRMSKGLMYMLAYTYGHALANSGTTLSGSAGLGTRNPRDYSQNYTTASWDIRHSVVTNFLDELPFGKGKQFGTDVNKAVDAFAGGWQINGILTLRTGQPFTLRSDRCQASGDCFPDAVAGKDPTPGRRRNFA
jgi:hypothetical protein